MLKPSYGAGPVYELRLTIHVPGEAKPRNVMPPFRAHAESWQELRLLTKWATGLHATACWREMARYKEDLEGEEEGTRCCEGDPELLTNASPEILSYGRG